MQKYINYIKKHPFDILVAVGIVGFIIDVFTGSHTFSLTLIAFYLLSYAADAEKNRGNYRVADRLQKKGLVKADIANIEFVRAWEETRGKGLIKYCIINGGVIFGFILCFAISILVLLVKSGILAYISDEPSHMLNFIGYTYMAGIISGIIIYRFLWISNERKFIRLTDPITALNSN